tara:strand:+ start:54 stop:542 length:489 start_codon:yes stop_codon:yes gene_type:complete
MPGYKKPKMTGETREQIKKREERLQKESRERARKKREDFMSGKKPQFNTKLKKAAKEGKLDGSPKFKSAVEKAMMYKPMKHKGPYMMKPGSREKDTPGSFREEVAPMYHGKKPMMFKGQVKKALDTVDPNRFRRAELRINYKAKIAKKRAELKAGYGNKVKK